MSGNGTLPRAGRLIADPPSITALATDALRSMILSGELEPGARVIENQLTGQLGVSRPPLREAMRVLEHEGLIVQTPRRGATVISLTMQDVYEIFTLRTEFESMAVRLGIPVRDPARLDRLEEAAAILEANAAAGAEESATDDTYRFHLAFIGLAGHARLEETYRSISQQLRLLMNLNRRARAGEETLEQRARRHRVLVDLVAEGNTDAVLEALKDSASHSFLRTAADSFPPGSPEATEWLRAILGAD
jgi:DNA-binding GntR family transcriptional regulator